MFDVTLFDAIWFVLTMVGIGMFFGFTPAIFISASIGYWGTHFLINFIKTRKYN